MNAAQLTLIIVALIGMVSAVLTYTSARRSNTLVKARDVVTEWRDLYTGVQAENARLNGEVVQCRKEVAEVRDKLAQMERHQIEVDAQHDRERGEWFAERTRLYRQLYHFEHGDDTTPPTKGGRL